MLITLKLKILNSRLYTLLLSLVLASATLTSCGGSQDSQRPESIQDNLQNRFNEGKAAYDKEDYLDAIRIFEEIRIQAPTSAVAAEAMYLTGMSRYKMESYSAAAVDFRNVRRSYNMTAFAPRAQYMVGESYYGLSPRAELDQSYSMVAINEYQTFLRDYPQAEKSLIDSAQSRIREIRSKLAHKVLLAAELYVKTEEYKSATIYFERVLDQFYDTEFAPEAQLRIAELAYQRRKNDEAKAALAKFEERYLGAANEAQRQRARSLRASIG
jgi:outer membrane protein assembly factor BamD